MHLKQCLMAALFAFLFLKLLTAQYTYAAGAENSQLRAKLGKGVSFRTADRHFRAKVGGLLQIDTIPLNTNDQLITDSSGIRRGRMTLNMQFYRDWNLRATYDFTADQLDISGFQLFYFGYRGIRHTHFKIGNLQEFVSLDWLTSSRNSVFIERAQMVSLVPPIHLGATASTYGDFWTASAGLFGSRPIDGIHLDNSWGVSSRVTYTPINTRKSIVHFGVSGAYREPNNDRLNLQGPTAGSTDDLNVEGVRFSSVGRLNNINGIINTEFAARHESVALQFEYLRTFRDNHPVVPDTAFDSWYVQGSWVLTGERRRYRKKQGVFGTVNPKKKSNFVRGIGAWEVAVRYSELAAVSKTTLPVDSETNLTVGLNWYLQKNIRFMANYIRVRSHLNPMNAVAIADDHANIFVMRTQIEF
ncbi:porin [Nitrosomonas sp.]|uniref:OprO/OprP family phosphate-selective porin n=1 Tax=Nitrosomonas sp. TaxID=42353 RepID=UPI00284DF1A2|nr:porin [Nitrosomonas sp.]MDR4514919.1 porin [Nitrosomonas sp.]